MRPSYKNQLPDLQSKSVDWFLYERDLVVHGLMTKTTTENWTIFFCNFIQRKFFLLDQCGGGGWAPPVAYGPGSRATQFIFGSVGRKQFYTVELRGNIRTTFCCQGIGYRNNERFWGDIGCNVIGGPVSGSVDWGNHIDYPEVRCRGLPTGALYSWTC